MKTILFSSIALWVLILPGRAQEHSFTVTTAPYRVQVSFSKTVHILFPAAVKYVDLGSGNLIAGQAAGADNVVRIKSAVQGFEGETNFSVITADGVFYTFLAVYDDNPTVLSVEMKNWLRDAPFASEAAGQSYIRRQELDDQSPLEVARAMYSLYRHDEVQIRTLGCKSYGILFLLQGIYIRDGLFYLHLSVQNASRIDFETAQIRFRIVDRKVARRTASQELFIEPVQEYRPLCTIQAGKREHNVYVLHRFAIPRNKVLVIDLLEKNGGRHQSFSVSGRDLEYARNVESLESFQACE